ncbi:adult-specific cuticular protein ACP-20-like [Euwallacea similis]|uniref:adult-specific cuticular protein ACP-20-like n=1 Tax=Euwallacea similis TaxID=1736056 RepID=UPI00344C71D3
MNCFALLFIAFTISVASAFPGHHSKDDHSVPANYHFEYGVHDPHSKDHKSQEEHRQHGDVRGSYTVHDPDGTKRIVEYTAGKHKGFQAVVKRIGTAKHPGAHGKHHHHGEGGNSHVEVTHWGHGSGR